MRQHQRNQSKNKILNNLKSIETGHELHEMSRSALIIEFLLGRGWLLKSVINRTVR